jgi:N-acetylated-alpha-linked acidic dipeptidase
MTPQLSFPRRPIHLATLVFLALISLSQTSVAQQPFLGYSDSTTKVERMREEKLSQMIKPIELDTLVRYLSTENRIAGSESDKRVRDRTAAMLEAAGLSVTNATYHVYLPYATAVSLEMTSPKKKKFELKEKIYSGESKPNGPAYLWANGYSASGMVEAPVIFVNFGLHADYVALDSAHVSVKGKIVLARYGRSYRGIKARLAEEHGAVGLLLYNDPGGDGYATGDPFPEGAARPMDGIQRGSIYNGHGDPTTPGYASTTDAEHLAIDSAQTLPKIPVMPISATIAQEIFAAMNHSELPVADWQGYLPLRYHLGGQLPILKLSVATDGASRDIWNTIGMVAGSELPNEWVIVGGHRDAWCPGAEDNGSGAAAVIAAARAVSELARQGNRPRRTIVFALWDAEEWGLIGSTEWVEQFTRDVLTRTMLYINEDECATGHNFDAGSDPLMRGFLWNVTASVNDPRGGSIYDQWQKRWKQPPSGNANVSTEPPIGLLGGGSDFTSFYGHLGVPSLSQGFSGPFGQYHSMHDNYFYVKHFGDTDFVYHAVVTKLIATEALRMANADLLPYDYKELASSIQGFAHSLSFEAPKDWDTGELFSKLDSALVKMRDAAGEMNAIKDQKLSALSIAQKHALNQRLHKLLFIFMPMGGLTYDSWTHNTLVTSDPDNGYADLTLPGLHSLLKKKAKQQFLDQLIELTTSTEGATRELIALTTLLRVGK